LDHQKGITKDDGKATPVNHIHLANVVCGEAMMEASFTRGAPLKIDDMIISTDGSKAGEKDFYESAIEE
jgi:hypothetical protein